MEVIFWMVKGKKKLSKYLILVLMLFTLFGSFVVAPISSPVTVYADPSKATFANTPLEDKDCIKNGTADGTRVSMETTMNAKVTAVADGTVKSYKWVSGKGYVAVIEHKNGMRTTYEGLSGALLTEGTHVSAGQKIGTVGTTSGSSKPTLKFGVSMKSGDSYSDWDAATIQGTFDGSIAAPTTDENGDAGTNANSGSATSSGSSSSSSSKDDDNVSEAESIGVSFYSTQTALSAYVNDVVGVNGNDLHDDNKVEDPGTVGNAGAYVGYGDVDKDFNEYIMSSLSHGSTTSTYAAWLNTCKGDKSNKNVIYAYTRFGKTLQDAGLDETATMSSVGIRGFMGVLMMLALVFASAIPQLFNLCLKLLQLINPFQFLKSASTWAGAFDNAGGSSILQPLVKWYSNLMDMITTNLTWTVAVPFLLMFMLTSVVLLRKPAGKKIFGFVKRVVFIAAGIPLIAGLYTGVLDDMQQSVSQNNAASQMVASTVVDFEAWVSDSRLGIPADALIQSAPSDVLDITAKQKNSGSASSKVESNGGVASAKMLRQLRGTTFLINKQSNESFKDMDTPARLTDMHFNMSGGIWDENAKQTGSSDVFYGITSIKDDEKVMSSLLDMVNRFMSNEFYRASDVQTTYANELATKYQSDMGHTASTAGSSNEGKVYDMFKQTNTVEAWMERESDKNAAVFKGTNSDRHLKWIGKDWNIFRSGTLKVDSYDPSSMAVYTSKNDEKGLSYQSMYNYLSTTFDTNSVVVYSNDKSVSENTKQMHCAVNVVGSGTLKVAMFLNMIVILGALCIIAFVFTIQMLMNNAKRGFHVLASIPLASIGIVSAIAQFISYVVAMIMELICTMFLYMFISDMFVVIATVVEQIASLNEVSGVTAAVLNAVGLDFTYSNVVLMVVFETLAAVAVLGSMLKYRRCIVRVNDMVSWKVYEFATLKCCHESFESAKAGYLEGRHQSDDRETTKDWFHGVADGLRVATA